MIICGSRDITLLALKSCIYVLSKGYIVKECTVKNIPSRLSRLVYGVMGLGFSVYKGSMRKKAESAVALASPLVPSYSQTRMTS